MMVETALPPVAEIVVELERALGGASPASPTQLLSLLLELHDSNVRQWDLEDETRVPGAMDSVVADAKRAIDRLNLTRHHLIEDIDAAMQAHLRQSTSAPLATESPGMVLDRLSVLDHPYCPHCGESPVDLRRNGHVCGPAPGPASAAGRALGSAGSAPAGRARRARAGPALRAPEALRSPARNRARIYPYRWR